MRRRVGLVAVVVGWLASVLSAQGPSFSPEMATAIKGHVLTEANADAVTGVLRELTASVVADPNAAKLFMSRMKLPLEQQIQEMERDPSSSRLLKAAGLSAKDYTVGLLALRAAAGGPGASAMTAVVNPANVAFLKAHPDVKQRFEAAERGQ